MQQDYKAIYDWVNDAPKAGSGEAAWLFWWTGRPTGSLYRMFESAHGEEDSKPWRESDLEDHGAWIEGDTVVKVVGMDVMAATKI